MSQDNNNNSLPQGTSPTPAAPIGGHHQQQQQNRSPSPQEVSLALVDALTNAHNKHTSKQDELQKLQVEAAVKDEQLKSKEDLLKNKDEQIKNKGARIMVLEAEIKKLKEEEKKKDASVLQQAVGGAKSVVDAAKSVGSFIVANLASPKTKKPDATGWCFQDDNGQKVPFHPHAAALIQAARDAEKTEVTGVLTAQSLGSDKFETIKFDTPDAGKHTLCFPGAYEKAVVAPVTPPAASTKNKSPTPKPPAAAQGLDQAPRSTGSRRSREE